MKMLSYRSPKTEVMKCKCGSPHCRGTITGKDWMKKERQAKYKGCFCWFLQRKIGEKEHDDGCAMLG